jgi:cytochrome c biogenesis protein CcdA
MRSRSNVSTRDSVAVRDARDRVITMFVAGVALVVVGLIGAAIGWPHMVVDDGELVQKGSSAVAVFSLGLVLVGFLPTLFAVVAWGVRSGMETADPPAKRGDPVGPSRPVKRVWSEEHGRFTDWDELNKAVPGEGHNPTA